MIASLLALADKEANATANSFGEQSGPAKENGPDRGRFSRADRYAYSIGTSNRATMLMILINGFTAGPAVSL
jgi:hypothetical protein